MRIVDLLKKQSIDLNAAVADKTQRPLATSSTSWMPAVI